jgi:hypothetical protein
MLLAVMLELEACRHIALITIDTWAVTVLDDKFNSPATPS